MRFDGYTDSEEDDDDDDHDDGDDAEIVPETDPEEDPEDAPAGEDPYRDIAHQRHGEVTEPLQAPGESDGQLGGQTASADQILIERDAARAELRGVSMELRAQTTMREFIQGAWFRSTDRVAQLEEQVRDGRARIHSALSTFDTVMTRLRRRVRRFFGDENVPQGVIDRRRVDRMIYREHREAIRRMDRD